MEQSSKNENTYDVFMNEVIMEDKPLKELEKNASVQTKGSRNPKNKKEKLKNLHAKRLFWKPNSRNALCQAFYYVNGNKKVDLISPQVMCYMFCHYNPILNLN